VEKETPKKKKLPQNTEALLDELSEDLSGEVDLDTDGLLAELDPNLALSLKDLANDFTNINDEITSLDLGSEGFVDDSISFKEKIKRWKLIIQKYIKDKVTSLVYFVKYFSIWLFTDGVKKIVHIFILFFNRLKLIIIQFLKWSFLKKLAFFVTCIFFGILLFGFFYVIKSGILYKENYKFIGSIAEVASNSFLYNPESESEAFYGSPRVKTYSFQLKPIVINLKRNISSNRNPMGFFEFVLDGSSGDVLVEVKARETEILDIIQRVIESMKYEEIDSQDGKLLLKENLRKELNKILLEGSLRKVQIQSIIIKP
jgi:flagellar basal body-associated protein FliL